MKFDLITIFPDFFDSIFRQGVVGKAIEAGLVTFAVHNLRDWTHDRHKTVDDRPFGGGEGMVMKCQPLFDAVETIAPDRAQTRVILTSAHGMRFNQAAARRLLQYERLILLCGRYEGVDERVAEHLADEELSIGDFVLSGGELAAAVVVDAVARLVPGVVGNEASAVNESFSEPGLLDYPHWTRPADFRGWTVPEVLLGGNHAEIAAWRARAAREKSERRQRGLPDTDSAP